LGPVLRGLKPPAEVIQNETFVLRKQNALGNKHLIALLLDLLWGQLNWL